MESPRFDRVRELKAFDGTKAGVKGLVDAGVEKVPQIFHYLPKNYTFYPTKEPNANIPIIDLNLDVGKDSRLWRETVEKVRHASEEWGFFQVVNHGIPIEVLDEMLDGVRKFNEQDVEVKKQYYTRDYTNKFRFNCNFDLYSKPAADWRDTCFCMMAPNPPEPVDFPNSLRDIQIEYTRYVMKLGDHLFVLISEALGLESSHLRDMGCGKGLMFLSHYQPPCPQPELTFGSTKHTDSGFITVLLQDQVGGLQFLVENQWVDVSPVPGALVINIGDLLQILSNGKLKSVEHRVLANKEGPRISVACPFTTSVMDESSKTYGPIKELVSEHDPPKYREVTIKEFTSYKFSEGLGDGHSTLLHFKK